MAEEAPAAAPAPASPKKSRRYDARRAPVRRSSRRRSTARSGRRTAGSGARAARGTIRIEVVQSGPPALSPIQQALVDQKKVILPKRARF